MLADEHWMGLALAQARLGAEKGEVPVGAVLVKNNQLITAAHNLSIHNHDASAHAEIQVLRQAGQLLNNYRLTDCILFTTLEPCTMCFGAMMHARIEHVIFAAADYKTGVCGSCINLTPRKCFNHTLEITAGVLATECLAVLQDFFKAKRAKTKQDKAKISKCK